MTIQVSSTAFSNNEAIPAKYTCSGDDVQPPLQWNNLPAGAQSIALLVEDPDAPGGVFTHWVLYDIAPSVTSIAEGHAMPQGAVSGKNDFRSDGYRGPCPPPGKVHHYHFKVFALDKVLGLKPGATRDGLLSAMKGHVLKEGELIGTFKR